MIAEPGWAGTSAARQRMLAYLPASPADPEPAYAIADAWWPPSPMSLPGELCDRILAAAREAPAADPAPGAGRQHYDLPLDPADLAAIIERFEAANALWWRFPVARWIVQAKRYRTGDAHPAHIDITPGTVYRRIAGMVQLSDPGAYSGGELRIRFAHHTLTAPQARGSLIALPAWTEHEVTRVTSGERWSLLVDAEIDPTK